MMKALQQKFESIFKGLSNKSIGIYGTGKNARTIIENVDGYFFSCLISLDHLYETIDGLTVLPLEEAIKQIDVIIIAAIPSSAAIVYNRIKDIVPKEIPIYDLQGYLLTGDSTYENNPYWNYTLYDLKKQIDLHDVISFDVFDTLITRDVLAPRDIFERMEMGAEFIEARIKAEEELYEMFPSPTITQIYDRLGKIYKWDTIERDTTLNKEISDEKSCVIARIKILDLFDYAISSGKVVYLTSDMYMEKKHIQSLLSQFDLPDGYELIVSCEYGKTKENGELFDVLLDKNPGKSILHIGDNYDTDYVAARSKGIDAFYIKKGYDLLAESSCSYLFDLIKTSEDKRLLGFFASTLFNDPFILGETKGKLNICCFDHIAASILPMTLLYLSRIVEWAADYDEILFASRDGYFIYKLYEWYRGNNVSLNLPEGRYIYVSRSAISSMSVQTAQDINVFLNKIVDDPKLNLKSLIENQFHITVSDEFDLSTGDAVNKWGIEKLGSKISKYYGPILEKASVIRERYLSFIEKSGISTYGKIAVVDIVTQGTLIYGLNHIFHNDISLFALGTSAVPNKYIPDISKVHSVYGNITERIGDSLYSMSDFSELHLFIEMLYASKEGQFYSVDEELKPFFVAGSEYDPELLENVQSSLFDMVKKHVDSCDISLITPEFALGMLRVFSKKYSHFSDDMKERFSFEDPYDGSIQKCNLIDYIQ